MMAHLTDINAGRFCWVDLAATDAERAKAFYGRLFGWAFREQSANGGRFTYMRLSGLKIGQESAIVVTVPAGSAGKLTTQVVRKDPLVAPIAKGQNVGSLYQLRRDQLNQGVASHWTPYIHVHDVADAARRAVCFDGKVIVRPFEVSGVARIALIQDSVGAHVGLWEPIDANVQEVVCG